MFVDMSRLCHSVTLGRHAARRLSSSRPLAMSSCFFHKADTESLKVLRTLAQQGSRALLAHGKAMHRLLSRLYVVCSARPATQEAVTIGLLVQAT